MREIPVLVQEEQRAQLEAGVRFGVFRIECEQPVEIAGRTLEVPIIADGIPGIVDETSARQLLPQFGQDIQRHALQLDDEDEIKVILAKLRQKLARARFIYYSWDSVRNNRNFEGAASYFDRLFTFDTEDAKADACLKLRPLFFLNEYRNLPHPPSAYDLCFVGTVHSDRFTLTFLIKVNRSLCTVPTKHKS